MKWDDTDWTLKEASEALMSLMMTDAYYSSGFPYLKKN